MMRFPVLAGALATLLLSACAEPPARKPEPGIGTCNYGSPLPSPWTWTRDFYDKPAVVAKIEAFGLPAEDVGARPEPHNLVQGLVGQGNPLVWPHLEDMERWIANGDWALVEDASVTERFAGLDVYQSKTTRTGFYGMDEARDTIVACRWGLEPEPTLAATCQLSWRMGDGRHAELMIPTRSIGRLDPIKAAARSLADACGVPSTGAIRPTSPPAPGA